MNINLDINQLIDQLSKLSIREVVGVSLKLLIILLALAATIQHIGV